MRNMCSPGMQASTNSCFMSRKGRSVRSSGRSVWHARTDRLHIRPARCFRFRYLHTNGPAHCGHLHPLERRVDLSATGYWLDGCRERRRINRPHGPPHDVCGGCGARCVRLGRRSGRDVGDVWQSVRRCHRCDNIHCRLCVCDLGGRPIPHHDGC